MREVVLLLILLLLLLIIFAALVTWTLLLLILLFFSLLDFFFVFFIVDLVLFICVVLLLSLCDMIPEGDIELVWFDFWLKNGFISSTDKPRADLELVFAFLFEFISLKLWWKSLLSLLVSYCIKNPITVTIMAGNKNIIGNICCIIICPG